MTNRGVCETFIRTLHTFLSTLIPIVILIFLGSKEILTFNLAMLFGFIAGAYSSIYIAAVIFAAIEAKNSVVDEELEKVEKYWKEKKTKSYLY